MSSRTVAAAMYVEEAYNDNIYFYCPDAGTYVIAIENLTDDMVTKK